MKRVQQKDILLLLDKIDGATNKCFKMHQYKGRYKIFLYKDERFCSKYMTLSQLKYYLEGFLEASRLILIDDVIKKYIL